MSTKSEADNPAIADAGASPTVGSLISVLELRINELRECLGEFIGLGKLCGHDYDCICNTERARSLLGK